ncbi:MAG: S-layer homology domain-containing protein [Oscillospiraceae bacterium]|nr:S-layer homology domain-containing protein [Oscillospiraceae bacterium]
MKKRWTAVLLALALAATLLPGTALAAEVVGAAGRRLTGADLAVYRALKDEVAQIADGTRTSTVVILSDQDALSWTLSELGAAGDSESAAVDKLKKKVADTLHIERVYTALASDCAYEMFWMGAEYAYKFSYSIQGNRASVQDLTITFQVSEAYQDGGDTTVSGDKVAAAKKAAENAKAIVDKYQDKSDYEKLAAYCQEICRLVSFDFAATADGSPYGDPWQLVNVFDGDPDTNVVCEGYSKAFQYLCDLSEFDGDIVCRTVTGSMNGGDHMWNVVQMEDGKNYLVDVTNCDGENIGAPDKLFLAGGTREDGGRAYIIPLNPGSTAYVYRDEQKDLYTDGWLALSDSAYIYDPSAPRPEPVPKFTDTPAWCAEEAQWAAKKGITKGYGGGSTFAPGVDCSHTQILTFLWRAADEPASAAKAPVTVETWYQDAIDWAYEQKMIDDDFNADALCTRADAVSYIWQALDGPEASEAASFSDVDADAPYAGAVSWAVEKGVTKGYGGGDAFAPDRVCTRGEIAAFLYRAYH